jgi:hypothetical protein
VLHGLGLLDEALREYNVALKLQVPDDIVEIGVYEFASNRAAAKQYAGVLQSRQHIP